MFEPFHYHRKFSNNRTTFRKSLSFSDNYVFVGIFYKSRWFWKTDYSSLAILENSSLVKIINHWQSVRLVKSLDNVQRKSIRYLVKPPCLQPLFMLTVLAANIYLLYLLTEREVLVKYRTNVFSTDRASAASQGSCRKTEICIYLYLIRSSVS